MGNRKVWSEEQGKMVDIGSQKSEQVKVGLTSVYAETLKRYATEDGYDFTGVSYVTEKDAKGNTKKDADGKPVFVTENGKIKTVQIENSTAKINSAIADYVNVAVHQFIAKREKQNS